MTAPETQPPAQRAGWGEWEWDGCGWHAYQADDGPYGAMGDIDTGSWSVVYAEDGVERRVGCTSAQDACEWADALRERGE